MKKITKNILSHLNNYAKKGLIEWFPVFIVFVILVQTYGWLDQISTKVITALHLDVFMSSYFGLSFGITQIIILIASIYFLSIALHLALKVWFINAFHNQIKLSISYIKPLKLIFNSVREIIGKMAEGDDETRGVIVMGKAYGYGYSVGYLTGSVPVVTDNHSAAYFPSSPVPTSGNVFIFPNDELFVLECDPADATAFIVSLGANIPESLRSTKPHDELQTVAQYLHNQHKT